MPDEHALHAPSHRVGKHSFAATSPKRANPPSPSSGNPAIPSPADWPGLSASERAYRAGKLAEIERRIMQDGRHEARAHASRARQFMPFSALKGYHELAHAQEGRFEE